MTILGVDWSSNNGPIDWGLFNRSARQFAVGKASQGNYYANPSFKDGWLNCAAHGIGRAAYHFFVPDVLPLDQAGYFIQTVSQYGLAPGDVPAVDFETPPFDKEALLICLDVIAGRWGANPWLYSNRSILQSSGIWTDLRFARFGLWLASWETISWPDLSGSVWPFLAAWQYTSVAGVPGFAGHVDESIFNGDLAMFRRYGRL